MFWGFGRFLGENPWGREPIWAAFWGFWLFLAIFWLFLAIFEVFLAIFGVFLPVFQKIYLRKPILEADTVLRERTPRRRFTEARSEERRVNIFVDG